jgi:hypothetical protein
MNEPRVVQVELSNEELKLLSSHLHRHLDQVDKELVRTDNPTLQHAIAKEVKVLEGVMKRLDSVMR